MKTRGDLREKGRMTANCVSDIFSNKTNKKQYFITHTSLLLLITYYYY